MTRQRTTRRRFLAEVAGAGALGVLLAGGSYASASSSAPVHPSVRLARLIDVVLPGVMPPELVADGRVDRAMAALWNDVLSSSTRELLEEGCGILWRDGFDDLPQGARETTLLRTRRNNGADWSEGSGRRFVDTVVTVCFHFLWWFPQHDSSVPVDYPGNLMAYRGPLLAPPRPHTTYLDDLPDLFGEACAVETPR